MVKLQRHKAYTYKTEGGEKKEHFKHLVVIPEEAIQNLDWREGQELSWTVANNKLVLTTDATQSESQ
jgi:hypothetical protein